MQIIAKFRDLLPPFVNEELDNIIGTIKAFWSVEHHDDGTHANIHADSITITPNPDTGATGDLAVGGDLTVIGSGTIGSGLDVTPDDSTGIGSVGAFHLGEFAKASDIYLGLEWPKNYTPFPTWLTWFIAANLGKLSNEPTLSIGNMTAVAGDILRVAKHPISGNWRLMPGPVTNSIDGVGLGSPDSGLAFKDLYVSQIFERGRTTALGEWIAATYTSTDYTSNVGASGWTVDAGDLRSFRYTLVGKTITIAFTFITTSIGAGSTTELRFRIPGGFIGANYTYAYAEIFDGTWQPGVCFSQPTVNYIAVSKASIAAFTASSTNNLYVYGSISCEIQ